MQAQWFRGGWALGLGLALLLGLGAPGRGPQPTLLPAPPVAGPVSAPWPLAFEPNAGQTAPAVRFLAHAPGGVFFFTAEGPVLTLAGGRRSAEADPSAARDLEYNARNSPQMEPRLAAAPPPTVVRLQFVGAAPGGTIRGEAALAGRVSYLVGNDPARWRTGLPTYGAIIYAGLYPGVDLRYTGADGLLKGTYHVAAGADPAAIRWRYTCGGRDAPGGAACAVTVDAQGNLQIQAGEVMLTEQAPVAWQSPGGQRVAVPVRYQVAADGTLGFAPGPYDRAQPLIIDPTLAYSSYLGGTNNDTGRGIAVDAAGNLYLAGTTVSLDFPTANAYQPQLAGGDDVFLTKLNPAGSALIYSTYLGGSDFDVPMGLAVDGAGQVTVAGFTGSANFPTLNAYQPQRRGSADAFVTRLNAAGSALVYSTYLGGSVNSNSGPANTIAGAITLDAAGSAYLTGRTSATDFPLQNPYQQYGGGYNDVFVTKFTPGGTALAYSTYLGGTAEEEGRGIAVDGAGNTYVAGWTYSPDFPLLNPVQAQYAGSGDAFVTKLNPAGAALIYSTYLGGNSIDWVGGHTYNNQWANTLAVDGAGQVTVVGSTQSADFPLAHPFQPQRGDPGVFDAFVTRLTAAGSALVYSTFLGGDYYDYGHGVALDTFGYAYVVGWTESTNFPLANPVQATRQGPADAFVTKFTPSGQTVAYSTFLGGSGADMGLGVTANGTGNVFLTGWTQSTNFPTAGPPYQATNRGLSEAFIVKIFDPLLTPTLTTTGTPPTATPTWTPTRTRTVTPTWTPTITQSPTVTRTPTQTRTPTVTGTPPTATPTPTRAPGCGPAWSVVPAPPGPYNGIAPAGPNDAWIGGTGQVLHWDGTTWAARSLPANIPSVQVGKESAPAAGQLWGLAPAGAAHWDGTAWTVLPYPSPPPQPGPNPTAYFAAVAATGATDVWFAGQIRTSISEINPYAVLHWDGSAWTWIVGPNWAAAETGPAAPLGASIHEASLGDISLVGANDFWAVGYDYWYGVPNPTGPIIVHNQDPPVHPPGTGANDRLNSVSGSGPNDVWMVGGGPGGPLAFHWDGGLVSVPVPPVGTLQHVLTIGPQDAWAASDTALIHWDGNTWTVVPAPVAGMLAAGGPQDIWAVSANAVAHWPDLPLFSDVLGSNPFYPFVQALACRGLISGYTCGGPGEPCDPLNRPYFRWGNNVTRGQAAKIVANAANFQDPVPPAQQTFADVPSSNPFWLWIERIASRSIIAGYTCGGPGEPCDPQQRPYFRAYNDVTRGQLAKIVSSAAQFQDPVPSTQQTFADVPPSQPFWLWVERVAGRGIISGYGCGGPGEPCDPQNRPYFRPGNPSTRAQTAKIVVNTFFPSLAPRPEDVVSRLTASRTGPLPTLTPSNTPATVEPTVPPSNTPATAEPTLTPSNTPIPPPPTWTGTATGTATATPSATVTGTPPTATPTLTPGCGPAWQVVTNPYPGALVKVAGVPAGAGPAEAWAVGDTALHWDGFAWTAAPVPGNPPLHAVAANNPADVWAVGDSGAYRWNGSAWGVAPVRTPNPSCGERFTSVAAYAPNDVWIVGTSYCPPLILHYNGTGWSSGGRAPHDSPQGGSLYDLADAAVYGPLQGWGVGSNYGCGTCNGTYITHLEGGAHTPLPVPAVGPLSAVVAPAATDAWAGGYSGVLLRWDGSAWAIFPAPNIGSILDLTARGPQDVWAVGTGGIMHWDGSQWTITPDPPPAGASGVGIGGRNDVWAVGSSTIKHYPDLLWFHDVPAGNPFYSYVQALACRGLISGYTCGGPGEPCDPANRPYYRPGGTVTRGQTAKIVANAAAFADPIPTTQQTFADVPPSHPFWLWIERIAGRGIISGYTCGGPGEPCDPQQRPYFRAYNDVTRGQLAKIVSSAAQFQDPVPSTQQTFADVPPSQPFWLWVERVAGRGIISGYGCGGPGEPCDPQNRPYFRPGNPSTRAQTAKVVVNTFFPAQ